MESPNSLVIFIIVISFRDNTNFWCFPLLWRDSHDWRLSSDSYLYTFVIILNWCCWLFWSRKRAWIFSSSKPALTFPEVVRKGNLCRSEVLIAFQIASALDLTLVLKKYQCVRMTAFKYNNRHTAKELCNTYMHSGAFNNCDSSVWGEMKGCISPAPGHPWVAWPDGRPWAGPWVFAHQCLLPRKNRKETCDKRLLDFLFFYWGAEKGLANSALDPNTLTSCQLACL